MITAIYAQTEDEGFGLDNKLPWTTHDIDDMENFVKVTLSNKDMVMGANTFMSFPKKLSERQHIVINTKGNILSTIKGDMPDMQIHTDDPKAITETLLMEGIVNYTVIGGAKLLNQYLKDSVPDVVYVTKRKGNFLWNIKAPTFNTENYICTYKKETDNVTIYKWEKASA